MPFPNPAALLVIPDHYLLRMLYSQGVPMESLGVPRLDGGPVETDPRKIWQRFAEKFYLFRGTPSGCWLQDELEGVFGIEEPLNAETAAGIYDRISEKLATPEFRPRALFERFRIEVLCTTDTATDSLEHHRKTPRVRLEGPRAAHVPARRRGGHPGFRMAGRDREAGQAREQRYRDLHGVRSRRSRTGGRSSSPWARSRPTTP